MGFFTWGPSETTKSTGDGWVRKRIRVADISYGHSPDKRGENKTYGHLPILVKRGLLGGYVVHDGNDRLYYAKQRGDTWIDAEVKE